MKKIIIALVLLLLSCEINAQIDSSKYFDIDYKRPKKYEIGAIRIDGIKSLDVRILQLVIGLQVGQTITIPGDEINKSISQLWKQNYFTNIIIEVDSLVDDKIYLAYILEEKPRLSVFAIRGLNKRKSKKLREELSLQTNQVLTENLKQKTEAEIKKFYVEKGYINTTVRFEEELDTSRSFMSKLIIFVNKGVKVKVNDIIFVGNDNVESKKLRKQMRNTKIKRGYRLFKRSKYNLEEFKEDKDALITYYNSKGFRDAQLLSDSIYLYDDKTINIVIKISEGHKFYFRNIEFVGNTKYTTSDLQKILNIKYGEEYNLSKLNATLLSSPSSQDISSLYLDDGYLFFNAIPVEVLVENDSIDLEIRINEGTQATINRVTIIGNTKTSDKVIMRELRTVPGQIFSRSDIQRTMRDLMATGYFNPEAMDVKPKPNPRDGTVDIEYILEEKSSDQIELSGGFGNGQVVGTVGLTLNNFSSKKLFRPREWDPVPSGDGQRLTIRAQSSGIYFKSYNFSFTEPWFGGKKPTSFTTSVFHSVQTNGVTKKQAQENPGIRSSLKTTGVTLGVAKRLKWPDDFFVVNYSLTYQYYELDNYGQLFAFASGFSNSLAAKFSINRTSYADQIFPSDGSSFDFSVQATPPISALSGKSYVGSTEQEKFKWLEYHKWKFNASYYLKISKNWVLANMLRTGYMGYYNSNIGFTPFERFYMGGSGLTGFNLDGRELVAFRGYRDNRITPNALLPDGRTERQGATIFNRFTTELRYRVSPNPNATVYLHTFFEAGNSWESFKKYDPFNVLRSAGAGIRIFVPAFGLLGVDYGYGFDKNPYQLSRENEAGKGQFHFFIGQQF